jgi:hypothetical protein
MVVQFSYGFTADGANRDLSFLDWCTFRRWIATDCDDPSSTNRHVFMNHGILPV